MIKTKIYQYDSSKENNGYRGTDFSKYVLQGVEITEDITQELDTAELTLCGLTTNKEFEPESKFIIDIWEEDENGTDVLVKTHHFCVARDIVSQPILSDDNYFDHHISFIEPSVVAQKRLVDNIAVTYKLKDVTLVEREAFPDTSTNMYLQNSQTIPPKNFGIVYHKDDWYEGILTPLEETIDAVAGKYFALESSLRMINRANEYISTTYNNIERFSSDGGYYARFQIPKLAIYFGVNGTNYYEKIGYASLSYTIKEFVLNDEINPTNSWSGTFISNSNLGVELSNSSFVWQNKINGEWLIEKSEVTSTINASNGYREFHTNYYKKYTDKNASTPNYITQEIPLRADRKYVVEISLYQFPDNAPSGFSKYIGEQPSYYTNLVGTSTTYITSGNVNIYITPTNYFLTARQTSSSAFYVTYDIETGEIVYASSTPYSALALLQKAILNSSIYEKQDGVYIADVNNSNLPFYIDENYIDKLASTLIIENFYNQKNLWEIMLEVGNYIHSIPELRFGKNDRFVITFNQLGRTDEKQDNSTKVSIFNSRSVEDYISATSSYITNMVQLGGVIEEWVVPKTTNETLIVSNDTAEIITSKPIIELIEVKAMDNRNGTVADITNFIYEENVYKTLQIDYEVEPNRGIAMFYQLGKNVITGGQYQLPQEKTNIYSDYAFKKILWCAFNGYPAIKPAPETGYWTDVKILDYSFFVKYRTKDSVRQNHIRPDLRKYLVNSKFDRFPEHNQFNNQTDVVVDSIKFGNNMYGKLIKTGNSNNEKIEWNNKYTDTKHKGELYRINGELCYVAKITHYYFSSYILSKTTYSKDYNELSKVVGIPSEPRFYEISEQSLIWREVALNDILLLTDDPSQISYGSNFVFNFDHLSGLMIGSGTDFAKFVITVFKGDKDIYSYDQTGGQAEYYKEIFSPVNAYSSENTLTYEWDMQDNYSAGDKNIATDRDYHDGLLAVPYTDIYGKVALLDFYILGSLDGIGGLSWGQKNELPQSPIKTRLIDGDTRPFVGDLNLLGTNVKRYDTNYYERGIGLLKDCREAISLNFNLQLATNSDTFVISPYVFLPNKSNVKLVLLAEEINKLSNGYIDNGAIITPLDTNNNTMGQFFDFSIQKTYQVNSWDNSKQIVSSFGIDLASVFSNVNENHFNGTDGYQQVKAIAILCDVSLNTGTDTQNPTIPYKTQFIIARNIPSFWDKTRATSPIYFGAPNKDEIFKNKQ